MNAPWLLLDVHYLAHRAFFAMGHLSYQDVKTGVIFGLLQDMISLQDQFGTRRIAFCFDSKSSVRQQRYSQYKANRREKKWDEDQVRAWREVKRQIKSLRREYLLDIGYRNVFIQKGYEADDLIGALCVDYNDREFIIVSSDSDFYQLVNERVSLWNPMKSKLITPQYIRKEFGIEPSAMRLAKALMGDATDNIEGIKGIGLKTACKFLEGKASRRIVKLVDENKKLYHRNLSMITLPYPGTQKFRLRKDRLSREGWRKVLSKLGIKSLENRLSFPGREVRKVK